MIFFRDKSCDYRSQSLERELAAAKDRIAAMDRLDHEFDIYGSIKRRLKKLPKRKRKRQLAKLRKMYCVDWEQPDKSCEDIAHG